MESDRIEKGCWNCLYEYTCDWQPAGEEDSCDDWVEGEHKNLQNIPGL